MIPIERATLTGPIAIRAFMRRTERPARERATIIAVRWSGSVLFLDTETTIDASQRLLFGSYRYCRWNDGVLVCVAEGVIYADELPREDPKAFATLKRYVAHRRANVGPGVSTVLHFYSRHAFVEQVFFPAVCLSGATVCGFNLPFDLSRLAVECGEARGAFFYGGFSFSLADYLNTATNQRCDDTFFARVAIKPLDSKRAFIRFTGGRERHKGQRTAGRFLDLRTLTFALTNASHSLASACDAFDVKHGKQHVVEHGHISPTYIDYNRRDVLASQELLEKLRAAYDVHPIELDPCKAYSPASISKAYLRALGVAEPSQQFSGVPDRYLGYAMSAYFGGRAEVRVRTTSVPVVYTDFLSMYPTDNTLMDLWSLLTAERLDVVDATDEVRNMLRTVKRADCFQKSFWRELRFFAEIEPDGDVLPVRARYADESPAWNIGLNPLQSAHRLWYAGPDVVADKLLAGKVPRIRHAFRIVPAGRQSTLTTQRLAGRIRLDPRAQDFFRTLIEERKGLKSRGGLSTSDIARLDQFLKVVANAGSYGVFAEMNANDRPKKAKKAILRVFGREQAFDFETASPEEMGKYCFPPIAALIPSAARLMLALLECEVRELGGSYVLCDTDSMAIVASKAGGIIECFGGPLKTSAGKPAIRALSWAQVDAIARKFARLSPYNRKAVPGSILKIEDENFHRGRQRQLYAYAISAKRYALYTLDARARIQVVKYSEHGLGHLLNPGDVDGGSEWIREAWAYLIGKALGRSPKEPSWLHRPSISRMTVSAPLWYAPFAKRAVEYRQRVKPFNFVLTAHVDPLERPVGADEKHFHLIAPYERDARNWLRMKWVDVHSGREYHITTRPTTHPNTVRVRSYRDDLERYAHHPEPKSVDATGEWGRPARGLLRRRPVVATGEKLIGKESHEIEAVELGLVHDIEDVQLEIDPPIGPSSLASRMWRVPVAVLARMARMSARQIVRVRNGQSTPTRATRECIERALNGASFLASTQVEGRECRAREKRSGSPRRAGPSRRPANAPTQPTRKRRRGGE